MKTNYYIALMLFVTEVYQMNDHSNQITGVAKSKADDTPLFDATVDENHNV